MSASIYYRYIINERHIDVGAPSSFIESMSKVFGSYPWKLNRGHIPNLVGMAALSCDGASKNPYTAIIDVIVGENGEESNAIEVWPEY